jgi:hypothetical protein
MISTLAKSILPLKGIARDFVITGKLIYKDVNFQINPFYPGWSFKAGWSRG